MWKCTEFRISTGFFALLGLSLAWGAGEVLPHVLLSALCHELGHLAALRLFGVYPERITLTALGAEITAAGQDKLSYGGELLTVLAGAAVNIVLALVFAHVSGDYLFAGTNAILAAYNLLPIRGLDGHRALYLILAWCTEPFTAERVAGVVNLIVLALLLGFGVVLLVRTGSGVFCLSGALGLCIGQLVRRSRKQNCISRGNRGCQTTKKQIQ